MAAAAGRRLRPRARRRLEPDAARRELRQDERRPGRGPCLLGAGRAVPPRNLSPSYRVEAVDTVGHWPAAYLPAAGIPIARGWYRQDDFPRNGLLYRDLDRARYVAWLRSLGVRYVVLPDAPLDYSAKEEGALLASGRSGLTVAFRSAHTTVYAFPHPGRIVTGPGACGPLVRADAHHAGPRPPRPLPHRDQLVAVLDDGDRLPLPGRGRNRAADDARAGSSQLDLSVNAQGALAALEGGSGPRCAR